MKKFMATMVGAALVFAAAGQASATALETKGEYRGRYWYLSNYNYKGGDAVDSNMDMWDQRLRLNLGWQVAENVKVGARADVLENVWDFTTGTNDKSEIDFDQAFVNIGIGAGGRLDLGKMDVSWGPGVYAKADNRYRARYQQKFDKITAAIAYDMITETADTPVVGDDWALTIGAGMPIGDATAGLLGIYRDNKAVPGSETSYWGIDGYYVGAAAGAKLTLEAAYAAGTKDFNGNVPDVDVSGLMAYAGVSFPLGPVGLGLDFGYASGDDPGTLDENEGLLFFDYNGPFSSFILFNNFDLDGWNSVYSGGVDKGLNNAMAGKVYATFAANEKLSFMGALVYAVADQTAKGQDDQLGVEGDVLAVYKLTENVTLQAGFGYLAAGEFYGKDVDDPWVGTAHAVVTF